MADGPAGGAVAIRLLLVDDHEMFLDPLAARLERENDFEVVGTTAPGRDAHRLVAEARPDVVVVGLGDGDPGAMEFCETVAANSSSAHIVAMAEHERPGLTRRAVVAGAVSVVPKDAAIKQLIAAVRGASSGESFLSGAGTRALIDDYRSLVAELPPDDRLRRLSEREYEILRYLVGGSDRSVIAQRLHLSVNTVRTHVRRIFQKMGVHSQLEAAAIARKAGVKPLS